MSDRIKMDAAAVEEDRRLCEIMRAAVGMQSFGRLVDIAFWLMRTEQIRGDVCEFGCYQGRTAALMMELTTKNLWLYDSFKGNPKATKKDGLPENPEPYHLEGGNKAGVEDVLANVSIYYDRQNGPRIIPKLFSELVESDLPDAIAFAHFDCNFYQSTMDALRWAWPRMSPGSVGIIDDYIHPDLHGVEAAVSDFGIMAHTFNRGVEPGGTTGAHIIFIK